MTASLSPFRRAQRIRSNAYAAGFIAAYAVISVVAYKWTLGSGALAVLWPCNGILAAALLLLRPRSAIATALICAAIDGAASSVLGHAQAPRAVLIAACDLGEAFAAAALMRRLCGAAVDLTDSRRLLSMALFAAAPSALGAGTIGTLASHALFGDPVGPLWTTWAVGDLLGMMVGAPSALIIARFPRYLRDEGAPPAESLAIVLGLCLVAAAPLIAYGQKDAFLIFPFMLLAAFRISAPYSALAIVMVSAITAGLTIAGEGPFAAHPPESKASLLSLQLFLACISVSTLIAQGWLTSLSRVRRRAAKALDVARQTATRAEENAARLAESEARYRILAENTADIIQRVDTDYLIRYASPSIRQLGYDPEALIGLPATSIVHPDQREDVFRRRELVLAGEAPPHGELRILTASGDAVWFESSVAPIRDDAGRMTGVVNVLRNISERKAAEATLRELSSELQRVARVSALGAFATSLSHEINQPLAAVVTNSAAAGRWLKRAPPDIDRALAAIGRVTRDALRASQIIVRLKSMVTKDAPTKAEFEVRSAILEVLDLTEARRIEASVRLSQALGRRPLRILGDRIQFQQVIMNLVLNAIEAVQDVPAGDRRISVTVRMVDDDDVEIAVEDSGPGVSPELRRTIFDNLFTTKIGGTGLGLPISRQIVEAHGGTLQVDSAETGGAVFRVRLPAGSHATAA
ncbi:MAG: ATP-binding protein [Caulobacteraceae bacterium]